MLFVADQISVELRAIVEFLNRQMTPCEVLAVELRRHTSADGVEVLVPAPSMATLWSPPGCLKARCPCTRSAPPEALWKTAAMSPRHPPQLRDSAFEQVSAD